MSKQIYIAQAVAWARSRGFVDIKANIEGYPKPGGFGRQQDGQTFIPDVTAQQFEQKSYFTVVLKTDPVDGLVSKLKLLNQLALRGGGQLYLLTPKGHMPFAKSVAANSAITAELINLG
ncbi:MULTISPECIES: hypothetical protein [unclassified Spirosoma]|uniref:hypothetical protein n=1 Tax=unclassified Spirosoma TaxID=2621999 RepID=UPI0009687770|nr:MULTISPECIES: hypothetical protein [unclassified Spirosoma]MBN8821537.1 hypothetical protein [Spirosoma sp.]OJW78313.1 MAG: hypothetical protein BGO59_30350 [Spirosoma sp. 48-14]